MLKYLGKVLNCCVCACVCVRVCVCVCARARVCVTCGCWTGVLFLPTPSAIAAVLPSCYVYASLLFVLTGT